MKLSAGSPATDVFADNTSVIGSKRLSRVASVSRLWVDLRVQAKNIAVAIRKFCTDQPQWLAIGVLYFLVWYTPMPNDAGRGDGPLAWCWEFWKDLTLPLGFQLYVPAAVGLLIWSQRAALKTQWKHLEAHYPEHHPKREGNLLPIIVGAMLLVLSHFVVVKGIAVIAAILIAIGVVYRIYGSVITRMLVVPFTVFLLMIPPPDSFIDSVCVGKTMNAELKAASLLLNLVHVHTVDSGSFLSVNGIPVDASLHVYSGFSVAAAAAFLSLVFCLYRRAAATSTLWMVITAFLMAFVLHIFRVVGFALTFSPQFEVSSLLMTPLAAWVELGITFGLTFLLMRTQIKGIGVKINAPLSVQHAVRMAGNGIETIALPLVGVGKVARLIGAGWTWSERNVERLLKAMTPKRKRRRRSSSSSSNRSNGRRK